MKWAELITDVISSIAGIMAIVDFIERHHK